MQVYDDDDDIIIRCGEYSIKKISLDDNESLAAVAVDDQISNSSTAREPQSDKTNLRTVRMTSRYMHNIYDISWFALGHTAFIL